MKVLVTGGTGTVGSAVVRALADKGVQVSVLSRDPDKTRLLPTGVKVVAGNLQQPATVRRVFAGFDSVFLLNPVSQTESHEALMSLCGMQLAKTGHVVYLSVHDVDKAPWLPHFGSKVGVEEALRRSGLSFTILRPNHFFQNDYWLRDAIMGAGIYPQPIGDVGVSRVDVRDIADAAAITLLSPRDHRGSTYDIVGPDVMTGDGTAAAWSRALGRPIAYAGNDLDAWEAQSLQYGMPDWMVFDLRLMLAHIQKHGLRATPASLDRQARLLGRPPRSFSAFAAETAAAWTSQA